MKRFGLEAANLLLLLFYRARCTSNVVPVVAYSKYPSQCG